MVRKDKEGASLRETFYKFAMARRRASTDRGVPKWYGERRAQLGNNAMENFRRFPNAGVAELVYA